MQDESSFILDPRPLQIDELARKAGIPKRIIREYESHGLIQVDSAAGPPACYPPEAVQQARTVRSLLRQNYTLEQIRETVNWTRPLRRNTVTLDLAQLAEQTGLSFSVLRNYIRSRLVEPLPSRSSCLVFPEDAVVQCRRVMVLRAHGLTHREIGATMALFKFPAARDAKTLRIMGQRLQRVLVQKRVLEELELRIRDWLDGTPTCSGSEPSQ